MTIEQAKSELMQIYGALSPDKQRAIDTLVKMEPKTGHWVEENINEYSRKVFCSECGCPPPFEHVSNGDVYSANGHGVFNKTKYCPSCGARMESEV